jgi:hypothetical protein
MRPSISPEVWRRRQRFFIAVLPPLVRLLTLSGFWKEKHERRGKVAQERGEKKGGSCTKPVH